MLDIAEEKFIKGKLDIEEFNFDTVRVKKGFLIPFILVVSTLVCQFGMNNYQNLASNLILIFLIGYTICAMNPLIDTFIVKFGWTEEN